MMRGRALAIVALLAVTGCATPTTGTPHDPPATSAPGNELPALAFHRTGGIAGVQDDLRITAAGQLTASSRQRDVRHDTLTAAERAELLAKLRNFSVTDRPPRPPYQIADGFTYDITVNGRKVRFEDGAVPKPAKELISVLSAIFSRVVR
ncbi:protealysin inhibitor emfourin [Fodinicola acaciae]|uniref:protealysin inhibitor emfourin n=1 Tax=Fodinicola acaciae TaxID=2681555 RepID=UPI0013D345CD|nr:protealysin inhibitor emfourin [Fodinicola acaciae]